MGSLIGGLAEVSVREGLPGQEGRGVTHPAIERPFYGWGCMCGENLCGGVEGALHAD